MAEISDAPQECVLVLQDGGVLVGQVTQSGDRYFLNCSGDEMQISAAEVMLVADSLEAAYVERRRQLVNPTAESHLRLADWCLRYNLFDQAGRELADARQLEPRHTRLALLERRLSMARNRPEGKSITRAADNAQLTAGINSGVTDPAKPVGTSIRELPPEAIERFTRKVQPVLVNNCTTTGCHQRGGTQKFQLDRAILQGMSNRRSTMQNLAAALELIDHDQPQLSRLLVVPREAHGGMPGPIFGPRREQAFKHLAEWVALVTQTATNEPAETASAFVDNLLADTPISMDRLTSPIYRVSANTPELPETGDVEQARFREPITPIEAKRLRIGAQLERWQPRDPFDPEIFNRQQRAAESSLPPRTSAPGE